jgi:mannose/fructose/N-acetylgalactosamine-specific phosphotransferase system component IID
MRLYKRKEARKPFEGLRVMSDVLLVGTILLLVFVAGVQVGIWWHREDIGYKVGLQVLPPD